MLHVERVTRGAGRMMRAGAILIVAAIATALAVTPAAARTWDNPVERAVFEICPKVFNRTLSLTDPAQVAALGYRVTPPRDTPKGPAARVETGEGAARVVISGGGGADPDPICSVWFSQQGDDRLLKTLLSDARDAGFQISLPTKLGDGTLIVVAKRAGSPATMVIMFADAGGQFGPQATTIIFMN